MKNIASLLLAIALMISFICFAEDFQSAQAVLNHLKKENTDYASGQISGADISDARRSDTAENGQFPYAVVITCSDSRVPPEHIFDAGIGDLFVIRTAGNVIGEYELGSVEYGAEHLHAKLVLVLGHTQCGAVDAALSGGAHGRIKAITDEISACLPEGCDARTAEILNVENSIVRIRESEIIRELEESGKITVQGAIYDITTGKITYLN